MKFKISVTLATFFCLLNTVSVFGQLVNDTTQMLYGPETTRILHEDRFFRGNYAEQPVDTSLNNNYSPLYWFSDTVFQQTLDNIGMATKPLLFEFPKKIGARLGRDVFDLYMYHPEDITYFDTRSPYSKLDFIQGTLGEGVFEGEFNRNIKRWWNAGIAYRRITANKQLGGQRTQQALVHNGVKIYTHLQTTNNKYHLFANYLNNNHKFVETGGVRVGPKPLKKYLFDYLNDTINLTNATGREIRNSIHIGQTYALFGEDLKLFYNLDRRRQTDRFVNTNVEEKENPDFYRNRINYSPDETRDKTVFTELENAAGITGNRNHYYYQAYLKNRNVIYELFTPDSLITETKNQTFIGGEAELKVNEKIKTSFWGEYKVADEYRAEAQVDFLFLGFRQTLLNYAPTLTQQIYYGNHHSWNNDFDNISADRSAVWIHGFLFHNYVRLELATTSIRKYVFYNQIENPEQTDQTQSLQTAVINHKFNWGKFNWENLIAYTNTTGDFIRVPDWALRSRMFYQGHIFKKALYGQVGAEVNYRSLYYADAYSPAIEQFYLQNTFSVENYPVVDIFVSADIKSVNIFLKLAHANEGLTSAGYFSTPFYPEMRRSFIFGVKWQFFD